MNNPTLSRIIAGSGIILVGLAALLGSLNIINFGFIFESYWPTVVIAGGLLLLLANPRGNYMWALLLISLGILWQLKALDVINFNVWSLFWPLVLMAIGWSILTNRATATSSLIGKDKSINDIVAILGGFDIKADSVDYNGSKITAILGGGTLDLRGADIKKQATIEIFILMGGVDIIAPKGWTVNCSVTPILGGIDNQVAPVSNPSTPVLNIVGTAILGGVDVTNKQ